MCLILLAWRALPRHGLAVAANRDEFHARPASPVAWWEDRPGVLAGRDLQAGGTWMGVSRSGRFAAVTNYRGAREPAAAHSRGALVTEFLGSSDSAEAYASAVAGRGASYSGYNLLACDGEEMWWTSNRDGAPRRLEPGVYGLGNLLLDSPDLGAHKGAFHAAALAAPGVEALMGTVAAARIVNPEYGTRCSTVLLREGSRLRYAERSFAPDGAETHTVQYVL